MQRNIQTRYCAYFITQDEFLTYTQKRQFLEFLFQLRNPETISNSVFEYVEKYYDERIWKKLEDTACKQSVHILLLVDQAYPQLLKEIYNPPLALFVKGKIPECEEKFLGFIGPRKPSSYGQRIAKSLAKDLIHSGLLMVSGLARGIDTISHEESIKQGKPTLAVLGCGVDVYYPYENRVLQEEISRSGAVISEYGFGVRPLPHHFPQRNRIIAGLCKGTLLIEAGETSGAKITADAALHFGREVYAVPGPIDSELSRTTNRFISQGAKMVLSSQDILDDYPLLLSFESSSTEATIVPETLDVYPSQLLSAIKRVGSMSIDECVNELSLPFTEVLHILSELELYGRIDKDENGSYVHVT